MHINVRDFQTESVGYSRSYKVTGERPALDTIRLTKDIEGEIMVSQLEPGLLTGGQIETEVELVCDRCLRTFNRPVRVHFKQLYTREPKDDEMPIVDHEIDVAPVIEQEIILSLPIKILHATDCPGIEDAVGEYGPSDAGNRVQDKARIKKGTKRGST